ncbi:hypothetical protein [Chitinophaga deserti]|uniref:hypothetical protein n=1 Tax=Chitinophaga deserti TaxID=2164099 RepID=UPI000D6D2815|nr:hypothetical protein [Chitinophaga deserti]
MKAIILTISSTFFTLFASAQSRDQIVQWVKTHQADTLITACALPFEISIGSPQDDSYIRNYDQLKKKFEALFKARTLEDWFKRGKKTVTNDWIKYEVKHIENGEVKSESVIVFSFRIGKDGKYKLNRIMIAG